MDELGMAMVSKSAVKADTGDACRLASALDADCRRVIVSCSHQYPVNARVAMLSLTELEKA